jgi:hypothetical protein
MACTEQKHFTLSGIHIIKQHMKKKYVLEYEGE